MERMTLKTTFSTEVLEWIFDQCYKNGLTLDQYITNLVLRDKRQQEEENEKESEGPQAR